MLMGSPQAGHESNRPSQASVLQRLWIMFTRLNTFRIIQTHAYNCLRRIWLLLFPPPYSLKSVQEDDNVWTSPNELNYWAIFIPVTNSKTISWHGTECESNSGAENSAKLSEIRTRLWKLDRNKNSGMGANSKRQVSNLSGGGKLKTIPLTVERMSVCVFLLRKLLKPQLCQEWQKQCLMMHYNHSDHIVLWQIQI